MNIDYLFILVFFFLYTVILKFFFMVFSMKNHVKIIILSNSILFHIFIAFIRTSFVKRNYIYNILFLFFIFHYLFKKNIFWLKSMRCLTFKIITIKINKISL